MKARGSKGNESAHSADSKHRTNNNNNTKKNRSKIG